MRATLAVLSLFACLSLGCDDDTGQMATPDLSVNPDLTMMVGPDHCLMVATCAQGCAGNPACIGACVGHGTAVAQMKFGALGQCSVTVCTTPGDGGVKPCSSATDTAAGCLTCLAAAAQGAACSTQLQACINDH